MEEIMMFFFCFLAASVSAEPEVQLQNDQPSLRIPVSETANLQCCYEGPSDLTVTWALAVMTSLNESARGIVNKTNKVKVQTLNNVTCKFLELTNVTVNDTGLYQCILNHTKLRTTLSTAGTFLQVFVPMRKTLNINERAKNSIITAQGVLLLLVVVIPGTMLLCKSKGLHELEKRKGKEEENIYEGLNLDDCTSTYHRIQRSQVQGPYQDVVNTMEEDIQLEKP